MDARWQSLPKIRRHGIHTNLLAMSLSSDLASWLAQTTIVLSILVASSIYLWPSPLDFPIDDTYIHFVYAENLSEHGDLFFNTPDEKGVGTSSLLWVLILAAGNRVGLSMHWVAKLVGLSCLTIVGIGLYHLLRPLLSTWAALAGALLVVLSGHMLWFALSGMETMLFLALGILALLCYRQERWGWLGIALGLLVITRMEGIILALVIGGVDFLRHRSVRGGLVVTGIICGLICAPWILYLWLRTGLLLPTSGIGRHYSNLLAIQVATARIESLALVKGFPGLIFPLMWIGYFLEFVLGGYALPEPYLYVNPGLSASDFKISIWAIFGLGCVVLPLIWMSSRRLVCFLRTPGWENDTVRLPFLILLVWMVLHNLCYMIYLPTIGAASRYISLNHIVLWLALWLGIWHMRQSWFKFWLAAGLTAIVLAGTIYWNKVYDANLEHMLGVRIAAADYLKDQIPEGETCAAFDVGALRYYSQQPLLDLGGLVDPNLIQWFSTGRFDRYLVQNKVTCLVVPGRVGTSTDGFIDILTESGLSHSSLFDLLQVKVFQIDRERWLIGYLPTVNYQATVTIYKLKEKKID